MTIKLKRKNVDSGDELPIHPDNIIHTKPSGMSLIVWYYEVENTEDS